VKGSNAFSHRWNDAKWYFASAENRDLFAADPERFAPQYGGY
jgi:YHS domain-containing protein